MTEKKILNIEIHTYLSHHIYRRRMRPKAVMNGDKRDPMSFTHYRCQHHMTRVERMDKIRRESIFLFHSIRFPKVKKEKKKSDNTKNFSVRRD